MARDKQYKGKTAFWRAGLTLWTIYMVNPQFKAQGLINFMVSNHPGSSREMGEIEIINLLNQLIWMGMLTRV